MPTSFDLAQAIWYSQYNPFLGQHQPGSLQENENTWVRGNWRYFSEGTLYNEVGKSKGNYQATVNHIGVHNGRRDVCDLILNREEERTVTGIWRNIGTYETILKKDVIVYIIIANLRHRREGAGEWISQLQFLPALRYSQFHWTQEKVGE